MADATVAPIDVRPLVGSLTINRPVGGAMSIGDAAYVAADGDLEQTDAAALATAMGIGVVVSTPRTGVADAIAGDRCDIVTKGPVTGFSGLTPGDLMFASVNAGKIADAAPAATNFIWVIGIALDETTIIVNPFTYDVVAVS